MVNRCKCSIALTVAATIILGASLFVSFWFPGFIRDKIAESVIMIPGTVGYNSWVNDNVPGATPRYYNMYFFNITNPHEVLNGKKAKLNQVGPFEYRQLTDNLFPTWSEDENVLTYYPWQWYDDMTNGADQVKNITTLNIPLKGILAALPYVDDGAFQPWEIALAYALDGYKPIDIMFTTRSAHELLFGYSDKFLSSLSKNSSFPGLSANQTREEALTAGASQMLTGKNDTSQVRQTLMWKGDNEVVCCVMGTYPTGKGCGYGWSSPMANALIGTQGLQFAPGVKEGSTQWIFVDVIFRSAWIRNMPGPDQHINFKGVDLLRFRIPPAVMDNAKQVPSNAGYNQFGPDGLINVTKCAKGMPIFLSKPYFLDGNASLRENIIFLNAPPGPVSDHRDLWDTYIDVEPHTGKTTHAAERLQINVQIGPMPGFSSDYDKVLPAKLPVVWLEKKAAMTDAQAKELQGIVSLPKLVVMWVRWCGVGVSAVMFVAAGILAYRHYHDPDYQKHNTKGGAEETQRLMGDGTRRNEMQDPIAGMGTDERLDYGYGAAKQ